MCATRHLWVVVGAKPCTLWWTNIAMENHHFSWENPLFLWPFSIAMLVHQRVSNPMPQRLPRWCWSHWEFVASWICSNPGTGFDPPKNRGNPGKNLGFLNKNTSEPSEYPCLMVKSPSFAVRRPLRVNGPAPCSILVSRWSCDGRTECDEKWTTEVNRSLLKMLTLVDLLHFKKKKWLHWKYYNYS